MGAAATPSADTSCGVVVVEVEVEEVEVVVVVEEVEARRLCCTWSVSIDRRCVGACDCVCVSVGVLVCA